MKLIQLLTNLICVKFITCKISVGYQAALIIDGAKFCGGALVKENFVVTAAQCVYKAFEVDVVLGVTNLLEPTETAFISTVFIIHEDYEKNIITNDIALVKFPSIDTTKFSPQILTLPQKEVVVGESFELESFNLDLGGKLSSQIVTVSEQKCCDWSGCLNDPNIFFGMDLLSGQCNGFLNTEVGSPVVDSGNNDNVFVGVTIRIFSNATYALKIFPFREWILAKTKM